MLNGLPGTLPERRNCRTEFDMFECDGGVLANGRFKNGYWCDGFAEVAMGEIERC